MTDLKTIEEMFNRTEILYTKETVGDILHISVERGYSGFVTTFEFDINGKLLDMGAYE